MVFVHHDKELKERALLLVSAGFIPADVAVLFGVSMSSIYRWKANQAEHGTVDIPRAARDTVLGRPRRLRAWELRTIAEYVTGNAQVLMDELIEWISVELDCALPPSTLWDNLCDAGLTYKLLSRVPVERDEVARQAFSEEQQRALYADRCIWIDESSKDNRTIYRHYGWAPRGQRATTTVRQARGVRYSILPAMTTEGYIAMRVVEGSVNSEIFFDFILNDVLPLTNPYPEEQSIIVLDNCSIHKSEELRALIEDYGRRLVFIPAYSPDKNPIEESFSCLKTKLRREYAALQNSDRPVEDILNAAAVITPEKARAWAAHAGYPLE